MSPSDAAFIGFAAAATLVCFLVWRLMDNRRSKKVAAFAAKHELEFTPDGLDDVESLDFALFRHDDEPTLYNVVSGRWDGLAFEAADYCYTSRWEGEPTDLSIALVRLPANMPRMSIGHENMGTALLELIPGLGDIVSDVKVDWPAFNDRFRVKADDDDFARRVLDPPMMQWLMSAPSNQVEFEILGGVVMVICGQLKPAHLPMLFDCLVAFARRIPAGVLEAYRA